MLKGLFLVPILIVLIIVLFLIIIMISYSPSSFGSSVIIRELQNILERACLLCRRMDGTWPQQDAIRLEHLPKELAGDMEQVSFEGESALAASEKAMVVRALRENNWTQTRAAKALGITRDNIRYRIRKYKIEIPKRS